MDRTATQSTLHLSSLSCLGWVNSVWPLVSRLKLHFRRSRCVLITDAHHAFSRLQLSSSSTLPCVPMQVPVPVPPMYAATVKNVSSFWPAGPNPKKPPCPFSMPANSSAEQRGCGYPQWHPFQILGPQSTASYGDNEESWCPATRLGESGFAANGDGYLRFAWDASRSFREDGFTEFIEVGFSTPVYVHSIEIGEPRGMGSIVRIRAFNPLEGDYSTVWESPTGEGDPTVQYQFQLRTEYRVFLPFPICQTTFKTDTLRIEMDTRRVTDWNELDYVLLTGSLDLPHAALPQGINEVVYVPNPDANGEDTFSYALSDCPFDPRRQPLPATVAISIAPVNDAPRATNLTILDLAAYIVQPDPSEGNFTTVDDREHACLRQAVLDLGLLTSDIDNSMTELNYSFASKPAIQASLAGRMLRICIPQGERVESFGSFDILYAVKDPDGLAATGIISYRSLEASVVEGGFNSNWLLAGAGAAAAVIVVGLVLFVRSKHALLHAIMMKLFTEAVELAVVLVMELTDLASDWITCFRVLYGDTGRFQRYKVPYTLFICLGTLGAAVSIVCRLQVGRKVASHVKEHAHKVATHSVRSSRLGSAVSSERGQAQAYEFEIDQTHRALLVLSLDLLTVVLEGSLRSVGQTHCTNHDDCPCISMLQTSR